MFQNRHTILILVLSLTVSQAATGQTLRGLQENQVIKNHITHQPIRAKSAQSAFINTLPFFEDFSTSDVFPDPMKWEDNTAFINTSFPVDPVSTGVATLDAIDASGNVYAMNDSPVSSDELTSQPFNLASYGLTGETIRISFFYQAGGYGEIPELQDSLLLEFYSAATDLWLLAWHAESNESTDFTQVILAIPDSLYQDGFKFRFRNYTSMSADDAIGGEGALSNVDVWNIDYIMMNTQPAGEHASIPDVTLVDPPKYLLDLYEIIPWNHLNAAQSITRNMLHYVIRNLSLEDDSVNIGRSYFLKDLQTGTVEFAEESYGKFPPNSLERRNDPFFAPFTNPGFGEEGKIEVGAYLITPAGQYKTNDTARTTLHFQDYYAYDDGIPEYGFGIPGESTFGALLAYRYRIFKPDTLKAIDIFFNTTRGQFTTDEKFQLCIWADDEGQPGDILYISDEEYAPSHQGFLEPVRFLLPENQRMQVTDTVIYVGFRQLTEEFLNIGYDVNRNSLNKIFVNLTGNWFNPGNSIIPGSLMIRPVFGGSGVVTGTPEPIEPDPGILLYPNPVNHLLYIQVSDFRIDRILVYDALGKLRYTGNESHSIIDVSNWPSGIYYVNVTGGAGNAVIRKIIVNH